MHFLLDKQQYRVYNKGTKDTERGNEMKYLVIECAELGDQWECDADRTPICVTDDYSEYDKSGYEIYEIHEDGTLEIIRHYDEVSSESMYVCVWNDSEMVEESDPDTIVELEVDTRYDVTKSIVKKIKKQYGFTDSIDEIYNDIQCFGYHGEHKKQKWIVVGEGYDDCYPRGF